MKHGEYIEGLDSFKNFIQDSVNNRLFHSIMLINKDGDFLRAYASKLAGLILNKGKDSKSNTMMKVEKEIHPDLFILGRDKPLDASDAKDLVAGVLVAPYEGDSKVYVIERFDEIASAPANKLLKTLEEPPAGVTFILLVKNETRVLQTLLSRAQKFYLEGYSTDFVANELSQNGEKESRLIAIQAENSLEEAKKLAMGGNSRRMADFVLDAFIDFKKTTQLALTLVRAEEFKEDLHELFNFFSSVAEMGIRVMAGKDLGLGGWFGEKVNRIAREWNYQGLVGIIEASITAHKMLEAYVQATNCLDQFFLKILEVRRKCRI